MLCVTIDLMTLSMDAVCVCVVQLWWTTMFVFILLDVLLKCGYSGEYYRVLVVT